MNKSGIFIVSIAVILTGLFFFFKSNKSEIPLVRKDVTKTRTRISIKESKYELGRTVVEKSVGEVCNDSLKSLEKFSDVLKEKSSLSQVFGKECFSQLLTNDLYSDLMKRSGCIAKPDESLEKNPNCISFLFHLKSFLIVEASKNKSLSELTPLELASRVVKMFFDLDKLTQKNFKENLKAIKHLQELYPNDPDVIQAYAGYMIVGKMITKSDSVNGSIEDLLRENEGLDFKIDRMLSLNAIAEDDLERAKISLDKLEAEYPGEADVSYYLAAYHWKTGNASLARSYLNQAIVKSQNCTYCTKDLYKDTLSKMRTAKPKDKDLFGLSINLNFENL